MLSKVSVVIPNYHRDITELKQSIPADCEVIVVDRDDLTLSQKRNLGLLFSTRDFILFVDDDNVFEKGAINALLASYNSRDIGIVGCIGCYSSNRNIVADGGSFRNLLTGFSRGVNTNKDVRRIKSDYRVDEVANAFMVKREVFNKLGFYDCRFDSETFPIDLDEADLCYRIKQLGYKTVICCKAIVYHNSITYSCIPDFRRPKNAFYLGRNRVLFQKKHRLSLAFIPVFVLTYVLCLIYRLKFNMIYHFLRGVWHGLRGKKANIY